jgi:predicted small secreted protein
MKMQSAVVSPARKLIKAYRCAEIAVVLLCACALASCAFVNAAGRAYEGAGKGLQQAADETKTGTVPNRLFTFVGKVSQGLGGAIVAGVAEDRQITARHKKVKLVGKQWDK